MSAELHFVDHEVEVILNVTTTRDDDDIQDALSRSGIFCGALIGEALIESIQVFAPEVGRPA